ncbi:LigB subunit of an aromatic-ring-opening dioxygenase LigAB [Lepidopterella palustris CBS 459.81]|uniref:LigB subunit of an aromatic-ring-opening dioxygenase LigAB n=1 Tax=Lepidopterella palustris CBS 459.81 TaxID=1314670 RepID=A0A8E2DYD4_9PEZI|nr:LigB subunit of an aromatic-ring-opening dioxygenase LigAB [Lepidopterella palustris CBS 459.81]
METATATSNPVAGQHRAPSLFVSHGAGPFAILGADHQVPFVNLCKETRYLLDGARGVILVTAHWETSQPHISSGANPHLYFDYFDKEAKQLSKEAWEIEYSAPGNPDLARRMKEKLDKAGFNCVLDDERGWDHGVWVPMILFRPQGDLPVVQISIPNGPSKTEDSLALGRALESFRDEGYVVLGSGSSYHNFAAIIPGIMGVPNATEPPSNRAFEDELERVAMIEDGNQRIQAAAKWRETFPDNEEVQPIGSDEHFMPFLVNIGAAGSDKGKKLGEWTLIGSIMTSYAW